MKQDRYTTYRVDLEDGSTHHFACTNYNQALGCALHRAAERGTRVLRIT